MCVASAGHDFEGRKAENAGVLSEGRLKFGQRVTDFHCDVEKFDGLIEIDGEGGCINSPLARIGGRR